MPAARQGAELWSQPATRPSKARRTALGLTAAVERKNSTRELGQPALPLEQPLQQAARTLPSPPSQACRPHAPPAAPPQSHPKSGNGLPVRDPTPQPVPSGAGGTLISKQAPGGKRAGLRPEAQLSRGCRQCCSAGSRSTGQSVTVSAQDGCEVSQPAGEAVRLQERCARLKQPLGQNTAGL